METPAMPAKTIAKSASRAKAKSAPVKKLAKRSAIWALQDAKAKFSELVRRARTEGPQTVTVQGVAAVVVMDAEAHRKTDIHQRFPTLYDLMQSCPVGPDEFKIEPIRIKTRVRPVKL
jgi:prevent-host-death family protein